MNALPGPEPFLIGLAREAIRHGFEPAAIAMPDLAACPADARAPGACFVTLTAGGELRGCRGSLEPRRALALDVWHNTQASACDDPRFLPLQREELRRLRIEISVLGPLEPVAVASEAELRAVLVPHRDGVVFTWRNRGATLLPDVWAKLPDPAEFLAVLRRKAGLPEDFWSAEVTIRRYRTEKLAGWFAATQGA